MKPYPNPLAAALLTGLLLTAGCATAPRPPPPAAEEIVDLSKAGVPADAIIERIRESDAIYDLPASALARLRDQGVSDRVIDEMQQTRIDAARLQGFRAGRDAHPWYYPYYRWPSFHHGYWRWWP